MSTSLLYRTLSLVDFPARESVAQPARPAPRSSVGRRLQAWLARKSRARMAAGARALLPRLELPRRGDMVSLDCLRGTAAGRLARLRSAATGSVDTIISTGALADATDVAALLSEIKRVLRPGGRLLFAEPVSAPAGTRLRRLQRALDRVWRALAGTADAAPRDLWNDLKAARFGQLQFDRASLRGLAGLPMPYIVGQAMVSPSERAEVTPEAATRPGGGAPALAWRVPAFAFFGH